MAAVQLDFRGPSMSCIQLPATHKDSSQDMLLAMHCCPGCHWALANLATYPPLPSGPKAIFVFRVSDTFGQDSTAQKANPHVYEAIYDQRAPDIFYEKILNGERNLHSVCLSCCRKGKLFWQIALE